MGWYAKKGERSQMMGLLEMFTLQGKNLFYKSQNKKNLLVKKYVQYQHFAN